MKKLIVFLVDDEQLHATHIHRLANPAMAMKMDGNSDFVPYVVSNFEEIAATLNTDMIEAVVLSRLAVIGDFEGMRKWFKANNIKLIVDLDDRWELPWIRNHATVYNTVSRKYIVNTIQVADIVWTASNFLNREVRRVFGKKHVYTIYNGIDPRLEGWKPVKKDWSGVRFGYFGALHHDEDIAPLRGLFADKHMKTIEFDVPSNYKHIPYYEVFGGEKLTTKPLPVNKYQTLYDDIDVSIAPLANTNFNRCKSALKIMEAGFKKCAIIASDVSVYRDVVQHGKTGLLCRTRDDWKREIDGMTKEKAEDLAEAMYDVCMDNYTVSRINEVRLNSIRDYIKS